MLPSAASLIIGRRFGKVVVLDKAETEKTKTSLYSRVRIQCDCGTIKTVRTKLLKLGDIKSCGKCIRKYGEEAAFKKVLDNYKNNAKNRKLAFSLSEDYFRKITKENCYYCASPPANLGRKSSKVSYVHSGIDRRDSRAGYVEGNCIPCCRQCNMAKSNMTEEAFYTWIKRVYTHFVMGENKIEW